MKCIFLLILILLFPTIIFASWLSKQEACGYDDGIHREEVYVYWPGKIVQVDEFLKVNGFIYYFIHSFPDRDSLDAYNDIRNNTTTSTSFIRNSGSFFVSYDCARSKVKFHTNVRSLGGTAYGKINWFSNKYLSYSLVGADRDPCKTGPDTILDMSIMSNLRLDATIRWLPKTTKDICVGRSMYKLIDANTVQFDVEEHNWATEESFYSRFQYTLSTKKLKKIR